MRPLFLLADKAGCGEAWLKANNRRHISVQNPQVNSSAKQRTSHFLYTAECIGASTTFQTYKREKLTNPIDPSSRFFHETLWTRTRGGKKTLIDGECSKVMCEGWKFLLSELWVCRCIVIWHGRNSFRQEKAQLLGTKWVSRPVMLSHRAERSCLLWLCVFVINQF